MANKKIIPAISVIIPMYNVEKYIGECLDSIFAQTFEDYEIIVVDDCSTDKGCEVVENYIPKFNGRLQLIKSEKNSGGAGVPRNIGIRFSRGKYIFLMDSDDALTSDAFEEFYKLGKEFDADVVYSKRHYIIGSEEKAAHLRKNFPIQVVDNQKVEEKITLETEDLAQRIRQICSFQFNLTARGAIIKRNLLAENEIACPNTRFYEDFVFIFKVQCLAKKFVHTPKPVYLYRLQPDSITHKQNKTLEKTVDFWISSLIKGLDDLNNFMDKLEFFQKNVDYRYAVFDHLANFIFRPLLNACYQIPPSAIYSAILQGEVKKFSENKNLIAYLLSTINNQQKFLFNANQKISELQAQSNQKPREIFLPKEKISSAISVIIPMYNAEKYIGECLDSIFAQTFSDYEIIVVDDCSTDKSCEVVENYIPKFENRLRLIKSEKNSGGCPGTPRNIGIGISRGKYLMFVDADDAITSTALEELYTAAEKFSADVVHCEKFYRAAGETVTTDKNFLNPTSLEQKNFVTQPTFMSDELAERINEFGTDKFWVVPWNIFLRRDLIADNNLNFPDLRSGEDLIFGFFVLCKAKKILRVPNVCYVWRNNQNSFTWAKMSEEKMIHRWCDSLFRGLKILDDFMANFELFQKNPEYKYQVFELLIKNHAVHIIKLYNKIPAAQLDGLIRRELEQVKDKNALTAFIFSRMSSLNINFLRQNQIIQQQQKKIQELQAQLNQK